MYPTLQLKQPLILSWLKSKSMWWAKLELDNSMTPSAEHTCATHHPEVTEMLNAWIMMACKDRFLLTGDLIHKKWWSFADMHGVPQDKWLNLSEGWVFKYKSWMGLKGVKHHGEAASASTEAIKKEKHWIQNIIKQLRLAEWDVFNMDETGLFYAWVGFHSYQVPHTIILIGLLPDQGLSNMKWLGMKSKKVQLTYSLMSNADKMAWRNFHQWSLARLKSHVLSRRRLVHNWGITIRQMQKHGWL